MSNENGSLSSIQSYLVSLASEYRLLKELQSRSEIQLNETTQKSEKLSSQVLMLNEHYKAYCQTLSDVLEKLSNMFLQIEKIKEQLNVINIRLEQVDGQRARCGDKFGDMSGRIESFDSDIEALSADVEALSTKIQQVLTFVKSTLTNKLNTLNSKVTQDIPNQFNSFNDDQRDLKQRIKILEDAHLGIVSGFKNLKIYGGVCTTVITILVGLRTLGWI